MRTKNGKKNKYYNKTNKQKSEQGPDFIQLFFFSIL